MSPTNASIRPPAVAGTFYPAEPRALAEMVEQCLASARLAGGRSPRAVIAPHAGYVYSGPIAGSAFAPLEPLRGSTRRVVLIGPSHRVAFRGLAAPSASAFATPLGVVPVDRAALGALRDLPQVVVRDDAHAREHSLEVELPFLQRVLGTFALVPLAAGAVTDAEVAEVLARFAADPATLIVISSDLSHYLPYEEGRRIDEATSRAIEALDPAALDGERACGFAGVRGLLVLARQRGLNARTLDLRSSGDTAGSRDQVVGYGAYAFTET